MTGYESKRAAAQDKLVNDRRAYYEKFDDLYAVYLNGVYDGKKAAQPAQEPVAWLCSPDENGLFELPTTHKACKDCFPVYTTPPQLAQEPVGLVKDLFTNAAWDKLDVLGSTKVYLDAPPQRTWVGLTAEEAAECWTTSATQTWKNIENALRIKNT